MAASAAWVLVKLCAGPCLYNPTQNDEGNVALSYTVVQKSNLREATTNAQVGPVRLSTAGSCPGGTLEAVDSRLVPRRDP